MLIDDTELTQAIISGDGYYVEAVLKTGADVHAKNKDGAEPIALAAEYGVTEFVELLVKYGADVNVEDKHGYTPLMQAACIGNDEMVGLLLDLGANPLAKDKLGKTAVDYAEDREFMATANLIREVATTPRRKPAAEAVTAPIASRPKPGHYRM